MFHAGNEKGNQVFHNQALNCHFNFAPQPDYRPLTKFENRGLKPGHGVWDLVIKRN